MCSLCAPLQQTIFLHRFLYLPRYHLDAQLPSLAVNASSAFGCTCSQAMEASKKRRRADDSKAILCVSCNTLPTDFILTTCMHVYCRACHHLNVARYSTWKPSCEKRGSLYTVRFEGRNEDQLSVETSACYKGRGPEIKRELSPPSVTKQHWSGSGKEQPAYLKYLNATKRPNEPKATKAIQGQKKQARYKNPFDDSDEDTDRVKKEPKTGFLNSIKDEDDEKPEKKGLKEEPLDDDPWTFRNPERDKSPPRIGRSTSSATFDFGVDERMKGKLAAIERMYNLLKRDFTAVKDSKVACATQHKEELGVATRDVRGAYTAARKQAANECLQRVRDEHKTAIRGHELEICSLAEQTEKLATRLHTQVVSMRGLLSPVRWPKVEELKAGLELLRQ